MRHAAAIIIVSLLMQAAAPFAAASSLGALNHCVSKAAKTNLRYCLKKHGAGDADVCRTAVLAEVFECADKFDPKQRFKTDPTRRKILYDACLTLHNEGVGMTAQQECEQYFPQVVR